VSCNLVHGQEDGQGEKVELFIKVKSCIKRRMAVLDLMSSLIVGHFQ